MGSCYEKIPNYRFFHIRYRSVAAATKEKSKKKYTSVALNYDSAEALKISIKFAEEAKKNWL